MDLLKIGMMGLAIGGLLAGCGTEETSKPKEEVDPKAWSIVTPSPEVLGYQNADVWVAAKVKEFSQVLNPKMYEAGFDDGYDYYSKARIVNESIVQFTIEGVDIRFRKFAHVIGNNLART